MKSLALAFLSLTLAVIYNGPRPPSDSPWRDFDFWRA